MERKNISNIAKAAGISPGALTNILKGRRGASWALSGQLENVTGIPRAVWMDKKVNHEYLKNNFIRIETK